VAVPLPVEPAVANRAAPMESRFPSREMEKSASMGGTLAKSGVRCNCRTDTSPAIARAGPLIGKPRRQIFAADIQRDPPLVDLDNTLSMRNRWMASATNSSTGVLPPRATAGLGRLLLPSS